MNDGVIAQIAFFMRRDKGGMVPAVRDVLNDWEAAIAAIRDMLPFVAQCDMRALLI